MKTLRSLVILIALVLTHLTAQAQNWQLVWSDEFNGSIGPDWVFDIGRGNNGWGNGELEYYRQENATIQNNALVITAKREAFGGANYTSARLKTQGRRSWKYGKIVARIAMPAVQGIWPAFWTLGDNIGSVGWPACGEIDIMEHFNTQQQTLGATHWVGTNGGQADYAVTTGSNVGAFNDYAVEWTPNYIRWTINNVEFMRMDITNNVGSTEEFHRNHFILLNLAVGGMLPGNAINDGALPVQMVIDYVRVYQDGGTPAGAQTCFMLVNKNSGKSIDLIGGGTGNGTPIRQWSFDYNSNNQRWAVLPTEGGNHFKIISQVSGKCLCVQDDSTALNAAIHAWDYIAGNTSHQWDLIDAGNGWYKIRNVRSGFVLDVANFSTADNATILQWNETGTANQLFRLQPWGDYFIRTASGRNVCVQNMGSTNGSGIIQYDYENNPWFKWRFESVGEGNLRVSSLNALGRVLCVANGSSTAGWNCHLWDYNPSNVGDQKVRILPKTNGKFKFYFVHDGMSWDIPGGQTGNNVPLQQYPNNGNNWQDFELSRVP